MIHVELEEREAILLRTTLVSDISDLGYEIANTDSKDYRDNLKENQRVLKKIVESLAAA